MKFSIYGMCLGILALVVLAGCQQGASVDAEPYKIGALFAVTGPASPLGTPERDTALLLEEQINAAGGINGRKVKIIIHDTKGQESDCVMCVKKLINEGVVAIVGPTLTGTSLAAMDAISRAEVPMISCAAGVGIVDPVNKWVFKTAQSDVHAVAKLIDYMKAEGITTVAMINDSNAFGVSGKEQLEIQAPKAGIKIIAVESFGTKDTDMTAQLTKIKGKNPQAVICWGTNPGPAIVAKNMKQLGMKMPLLMSHGIANSKFIELAGDAANGVIFPAGRLIVADAIADSDPQRQTLIDYRDTFQSKFNRDPDTFGGHAWDAIQIVVKALEEVGDDKAKLRDAIENTNGLVGIGGVFSFTQEDHNGLTKDAFVMVTIDKGEWRLAQ